MRQVLVFETFGPGPAPQRQTDRRRRRRAKHVLGGEETEQGDAQEDAVDGEGHEAEAGEQADEEFDRESRADEGDNEADEEVDPAEGGDHRRAAIEGVLGCGGAEQGQTEEKAEFGGAGGFKAHEIAGYHRGHRPAHAGPEREALAETHQQGGEGG